MDTSTTSLDGGPRKIALEELDKEELIKKCRSLLTIAQKAKHSRDSLAEENNRLKSSASEEVIESLTQQKLALVTTVDELKKHKQSADDFIAQLKHQLEETDSKANQLDTENQGYKRQVNRLIEENEQLLVHLDGLEAQIDELKKIGLEQQQQLLVLEHNNEEITKSASMGSQVEELEKMLQISLNEVKKLKCENEEMHAKLAGQDSQLEAMNSANDSYISQLEQTREQLKLKDQEFAKQTALVNELNSEIQKNRVLAEQYKQDATHNEIESSGMHAEMADYNEKLRDRLKSYHGKIIKLAGDVKRVKESKEYILDTFKKYNQQVTLWREQLSQVSAKLNLEIQQNIEGKLQLEQKIEILTEALKKAEGKSQDEKLQEFTGMKEENMCLHETINKMRVQIASLETENQQFKNEDMPNSMSQLKLDLDNALVEVSNKKQHITKLEETLLHERAKADNYEAELTQIKELNTLLLQQVDDLKLNNNATDNELNELKLTLTYKEDEIENLQTSHDNELKILKDMIESEKNERRQEEDKHLAEIERLQSSVDAERAQKVQLEATIEDHTRLINELRKAIEKLELDAVTSHENDSKLSEQLNETILQLRQENRAHQEKIDELQRNLEPFAEQPADLVCLKRENEELLAEMNVMNQALKERGETISQQQSHCEEMMKKIQAYEGQLAKSQENVQVLQEEVNTLRCQITHDGPDDDTLSTSTISRTDEVNRLKELEGSWEERYCKLRTYALKLKAKAKELQEHLGHSESEKNDLQTRYTSSVKSVQSMQTQLDSIQDKLDETKEEKRKLEQASKDNQKLLLEVSNCEATIAKLTAQIETLNQEKSNLDTWKKQVGAKVQSLKKELEANGLMRKDFEARIQKLQAEVDAKNKELQDERNKHQSTRSQLQESNNECKKQSVLNLEMQDYERSIKELSSKLERKNEQVTKLKNQIDAQKGSVNAIKETNRLLEEKTSELDIELQACHIEIKAFKKQIADLEIMIGDKELKIEEITNLLENTRSENEDLSTQLSKIITDHQKANNLLREEKDHFRNENVELEQRARKLEDALKLRTDELANINTEFQSYKVRAQSVLRQNQSRDVGVEEKLTEEADSLRAQIQISNGDIHALRIQIKELEALNEKLTTEKNDWEVKRVELQSDHDNALLEIEKMNMKQQQLVQEHNETIRNLKLHTETLSQCYRQQISEQEVRHNREIIELQSKYDKNVLSQPELPSLMIPSTIREEGEGSESVDSNNGNTIHPLEKLLGGDQDQELVAIKKQLSENESRVLHLTALLADTEQDLAKHVQMNKVLKEEIRRQQRSVERERHAENLEYMKNVVFKFITLSSGDERLRLVPVLNTILKLSPEETGKLTMVAKGEKSWSTYLPLWSSPGGSKPQ